MSKLRTVVILLVIYLCTLFFYHSWSFYFPVYLKKTIGLNVNSIGFLYTLMYLLRAISFTMASIVQNFFGIGRSLKFGFIIQSLVLIMLALAIIFQISPITPIIYLTVIVYALISGFADIAILGTTLELKSLIRISILGLYISIPEIAIALGPLVGGYLIQYHNAEAVSYLILATGLSYFSALFIISRVTFEEKYLFRNLKDLYYSFKDVFKDCQLRIFSISAALAYTSSALAIPFIPLFAHYVLRYNTYELGILISIQNFSMIISPIVISLFIKNILHRKSKECITLGWILLSLTLLCWSYVYSKVIGIILFFLLGFFISFSALAYLESLVKLSARHLVPSLCIGIVETIAQLPDALGPSIGAYLWSINEYLIFYFIFVMNLVASILLFLIRLE